MYKAEKQFEAANEKEALSGHSKSAESSSLVQPSVEVSKSLVPRRCIPCRASHIRCVPLGAGCVTCDRRGKSCTFRPADLEYNKFLPGNPDPLATSQGQSVDHEVDKGKELSCEMRFGSAFSSQGPGIMTKSGYSGMGRSSQGSQRSRSPRVRVSGPLHRVNESLAQGNDTTRTTNTVDFLCSCTFRIEQKSDSIDV